MNVELQFVMQLDLQLWRVRMWLVGDHCWFTNAQMWVNIVYNSITGRIAVVGSVPYTVAQSSYALSQLPIRGCHRLGPDYTNIISMYSCMYIDRWKCNHDTNEKIFPGYKTASRSFYPQQAQIYGNSFLLRQWEINPRKFFFQIQLRWNTVHHQWRDD